MDTVVLRIVLKIRFNDFDIRQCCQGKCKILFVERISTKQMNKMQGSIYFNLSPKCFIFSKKTLYSITAITGRIPMRIIL